MKNKIKQKLTFTGFNYKIKMYTLLAFIVFLILDQMTKYFALKFLTTDSSINLLGSFLSLKLLHNPGAGFGINADKPYLTILLASLIGLLFLLYTLFTTSKNKAFFGAIILAGILGNILDRFLNTGFMVTDFLSIKLFNFNTVCNLADIFIVFGGILFSIFVIFGDYSKEKGTKKDV